MASYGSTRARASGAGRTRTRSRPLVVWALVGPMAFLSSGGYFGGMSFIVDPTGRGLGADPSWLEQTPVGDFVLPGLFLFGVYGVGVAVLIGGLISRRPPWHPLSHHWSWVGTIGVGGLLVAWIVYELWAIEETMILQPILIGVGLAMVAIPLLPSMRRFYGRPFSSVSDLGEKDLGEKEERP